MAQKPKKRFEVRFVGTRKVKPRNTVQDRNLDRYLTHFYVIIAGDGPHIIGEAGNIKRINRRRWTAQIAFWNLKVPGDIEKVEGTFTPHEVKAPISKLVSKYHYRGPLPKGFKRVPLQG